MDAEIEKYDLHVPPITPNEEAIFEEAKNEIKHNIDDLAFDIGNKRMQKEYPTASHSAYSAEGTLKVCTDSPDQFS